VSGQRAPWRRPAPRARRGGFALLLVLVVLVAVTAAATEIHLAARSDRLHALNARAGTRARWAARGGLARGLDQLGQLVRGASLSAGALVSTGDAVVPPLEYVHDGQTVRVSITDARARVQLNRAEAVELAALLEATGAPRRTALEVADAVLDWRDADDLHRPNGAERGDYIRAGSAARPTNAPFAAVEEITAVRGVTPAVYARLAPHLTVSGDGRVNVNSASAPVLRTLPWIDAAAADAILRRRARAPYRNVFELAPSLPEPARTAVRERIGAFLARLAFDPRDVELTVQARAPGAAIGAELHAAVTLTGGAGLRLNGVIER
jgi:general secretion pathway protein K